MLFIKKYYTVIFLILFTFSCKDNEINKEKSTTTDIEKTVFQTSSEWMPEIDIRADVAIVYGVNGNPSDGEQKVSFEDRVNSWRDKDYKTHFMTGIAWGAYQDYFLGEWDGKNHLGEGQVEKNGDTIWHGRNVPYIVPTKDFIEYLKKSIIERVINNGITDIYLEEPEFWSRAGYSSAFKDEWQKFYGFPWRPQHESAENTYLSSKLKYELYYNAVKEVSSYAKDYGKTKGLDVKVFIPTHSLVNYSSWQIVSPEASLASLPSIDGYIAQVWTGTAREPTYYNGILKERTFENAFLEYGSMVSMTAPTNRKLFFLTDPIEDRRKTWEDYKKNYEATFTAQLLYPNVANYEVMPWPERIYTKPYQVATTDEKILIPKPYSTQMQIMINALNDIPTSENKVSGTNDIGVLMGNSLMFQRFPNHDGFEDPQFSNFYGQTLPLVKRGVPVQMVHMENLSYEATLKNITVLVMSYANMKPTNSKVHEELKKWVSNGGVIIYIGRDDDPYQSVKEWWNSDKNNYKAPSEHLFTLLNIPANAKTGSYNFEKGKVYVIRENPKEFVQTENNDTTYIEILKSAYNEATNSKKIKFKNTFYLQRGPYLIASVLDESMFDDSYTIYGPLIDLFDPKLPILSQKTIELGEQAFLYDLSPTNINRTPKVLASASRIYDQKIYENSFSFIAKSPLNTYNAMRIQLPSKPIEITLFDGKESSITSFKSQWDKDTRTLLLEFENSDQGINVGLKWQ